MLSVIMPLYNAVEVVGQQLDGLAAQTYRGRWELVVADNGSSDGGVELVRRWQGRVPALRVVDASARRGAAVARNLGAAAAHGEALAFCDADDIVTPGWLTALAGALERHDLVAGACDHQTLNPAGTADWHARSFETGAPTTMGFLPYASSANMAVSAAAFRAAGGFDEGFADLGAAGEDVDLSWRLQLAGHGLHFEPAALVRYRHRRDLHDIWRQNASYGMADVLLYRRFRDHGVRPRTLRQTLGSYRGLVLRVPAVGRRASRGVWLRDVGHRWGRVCGSVQQRVAFL